ncbi:MAG: tRNA (guanosine(46)-N7)-methyltransferase TrmB [Clostridia bacterium]|nr:tRNA (guanosine(46)-N7)-methyltransferase TrmB [Clostridia bacterium]MBQ9598380.1 tRNA (guanosine(46)-N7)-methyltransferase TrmB [Clostridia bacterium]
MRMRKKKNLGARWERCAAYLVDAPDDMKGKWSERFGNDRPIHLEIGCGKGGFVTGMAKMYPDVNFIAVEKVQDVMVMAMEKAAAAGLTNVLFMDMDAERIEDVFEKGEISRIYLNFSDPWKKNKQAKRRLTHKRFLDRYKNVLNNGDYIWFKTDNKALFEFSLNSFAEENFKMQNITLDLHNSKFEGNIMTEYETRFSEMGMPIYRVEATYLGWNDTRDA